MSGEFLWVFFQFSSWQFHRWAQSCYLAPYASWLFAERRLALWYFQHVISRPVRGRQAWEIGRSSSDHLLCFGVNFMTFINRFNTTLELHRQMYDSACSSAAMPSPTPSDSGDSSGGSSVSIFGGQIRVSHFGVRVIRVKNRATPKCEVTCNRFTRKCV